MSKVTGLAELKTALEGIPDALQRNVVRSGNRAVAEKVRKQIKAGSWPETLKHMVAVDLADKRKMAMPPFVVGLRKPWSKLAHLFEFGTQQRVRKSGGETGRMVANPAMRQALEAVGGDAEKTFVAAASRNFALQMKKARAAMIGAGLFAKLTGDSGVSALVDMRVYPQEAPENADYPHLTYQQIVAGPARRLDGASMAFGTLQQIDIYARTKASAEAVADAVRACLDGRGRETWGTLAIKASSFDEQYDGSFEDVPNLHRIIQQYRIWR